MENLRLWYDEVPPKSEMPYEELASEEGTVWERWTLPLGNGYFGASYYGYPDTDRIQITENSLCNPYARDHSLPVTRTSGNLGLSSFGEIFIDFGHTDITSYERYLDIENAISGIRYTHKGVRYERELFTSYPDHILAMRIRADKKRSLSFLLRAEIAYLRDYAISKGDGFGKSGEVKISHDTITLSGVMHYYNILFEGRLKVINTGGELYTTGDGIGVSGADEVVILFSCGTNYRLESRVFEEEDPKSKLTPYESPREKIKSIVDNAVKKGYEAILLSHNEDYRSLFTRVRLNIGDDGYDIPTDRLISSYREGKRSRYLEALLFQYGRYLLISSSRRGSLPANLQGVWNNFASSPWSAGYWHNINVQMNYWPSCVANISEAFLPYSDYNQAYMPSAKKNADRFIKNNYPDRYTADGTNGWIISTGGWPYMVEGFGKISHSGPGTGAFTSLLFWDYYDFTRDKEYLRRVAYPVLRDMSVFLSKTLRLVDGRLLTSPSASPEIVHNGRYYITEGCAFDQQMIYENHKRVIEASEILGITEPIIERLKEELPLLDPVIIGESGQVKEFREEGAYGEFGEYRHRHVSQLVGMYPGTLINSRTSEWLRGAKVTLTERGMGSSGWSGAHRILLWARAKCEENATKILHGVIEKNFMQNLWDQHPPFQIDGNFGYTAGICEMLLQSHEGYIELLPAPPTDWQSGEFSGLVARGNFVIDCKWEDKKITYIKALSRVGGPLSLRLHTPDNARLFLCGKELGNESVTGDILSLNTQVNDILEVVYCK